MEQETKEHHASELVNNILEPCQLLLYGIQETHWLSQEATLKVSGYLFLCFRHDNGLDHDKVAFALALRAIANLFSWEACGPCLLRAKLLLEKGFHLWVIVTNAHIATDPNDTTKDQFYDTFLDLVIAIPARYVTFILGDFNAQVGSDFSN